MSNDRFRTQNRHPTVYPKKYAHGFCFAVLCCGYTLIEFPITIRLTSLALRQSDDCPSASKATLVNMDKYVIWIHYERLHNHKAKHNKTVCIYLGIYCKSLPNDLVPVLDTLGVNDHVPSYAHYISNLNDTNEQIMYVYVLHDFLQFSVNAGSPSMSETYRQVTSSAEHGGRSLLTAIGIQV